MAGFCRMDKKGRRTGAGHRGRYLAGDMSGFADAADHDPPAALQHEPGRAHEVVVDLVEESENCIGFDLQDLLAERDEFLIGYGLLIRGCHITGEFRYFPGRAASLQCFQSCEVSIARQAAWVSVHVGKCWRDRGSGPVP